MAKQKKLKPLAHRLFSAMLSLLQHALPHPPISSSSRSACSSRWTQPMQRDGCPPPTTMTDEQTLVVDVDTVLLRSSSGSGADLFPYFMLVALEAGSFLHGLLLLLLYPLVLLLPGNVATTTMTSVAFCGLRASRFRAGRAVLPKWFMEDVAAEAFEVVTRTTSRRLVCITGMPRVMVEGFLREYMGADVVVGWEMNTLWGFYTGLMVADDHDHREVFMVTDDNVDGGAVVGFSVRIFELSVHLF